MSGGDVMEVYVETICARAVKKKKQHKSDEKLEMVTRKELCRTGAGVPQL